MSRRIVIDASIAKSAGGSANPTSRCCREFLEEVFSICHRMVLTQDIDREWKDHASGFTVLWRAAMESKGKVARVRDSELRDLSSAIDSASTTAAGGKAMLKDAHLIAAAMAADSVIASRDAKARALFSEIASSIGGLGAIAWQQIEEGKSDAVEWLRAGARPDKDLRLGR